jgi:hypothetical protein
LADSLKDCLGDIPNHPDDPVKVRLLKNQIFAPEVPNSRG